MCVHIRKTLFLLRIPKCLVGLSHYYSEVLVRYVWHYDTSTSIYDNFKKNFYPFKYRLEMQSNSHPRRDKKFILS